MRHYFYKIVPKSWEIKYIIRNNEKSIKILREEANNLIKAINQLKKIYGKNEETEELASIFAFLNLSMIDIILLFNSYLKSNSVDEKHLICRTAALHMYEFLEDGSKIFGTGLKKLSTILKASDLDADILEIRKLFFSLRKKNIDTLKVIRNNVSGHKERNVRKQITVSESIDINKFDLFFFEFLFILFPYAKLKKKLKPHIGEKS
ncbi:hypothetical protein SAMN04489724_2593 [Algoriphagus locisalis]|uniref:HEPN AbiU2-like domain-containing protein n=2 Tax=Algoriphagus locisalis TaxID=305507 RepID=A0A1I7BPK3_9BACT|nr:hypothetical protein SAMN04489724_2593 [Algoriphagus locisalis]